MQARPPRAAHPDQLHLALFAPHEIRVWEEEQLRQALRRSRRTQRAARRCCPEEECATPFLFDGIGAAVMDPGRGGLQDGDEHCHAGLPSQEPAGAQRVTGRGAEAESWSDDAVEQLHEAVLHHSLKALQARGNGAEQREILQWIFDPEPLLAVLRDVHGKPTEAILPQSLTPFSFERCCRICGYSPERLRAGLMPVLREVGLGNVFNEIANGTNQHTTSADGQALQDPRHLQHARGLGGRGNPRSRARTAGRAAGG
jgi:hypothetical protein